MIISADDLLSRPEFSDCSVDDLKNKLSAIEQLIRAYTNNNFQNRFVRFCAGVVGGVLTNSTSYLKAGDTVQISQSKINDGLYVVMSVTDTTTTLDKQLHDMPRNLVTKVEYPDDIKNGVLELMKWEAQNRNKVGIKSETLSRHSVTYYDQDVNNQVMGYPVSLLGFLQTYKRARF